MESPSASISIPAAPSDSQFIMASQPVRQEQGKFNKDETDFLKTHLPAYSTLCHQLATQATGPRGTGSVKGFKKDWILTKVYPEFVKQYSSDENGGPQLQSLQTKILRWFANHSPHRSSGSDSTTLIATSPIATSKRPRATNGVGVFAKEHKVKILKRMAEQQVQDGGTPKQTNLMRYRTTKQELYSQLTNKERLAYEDKASEKNEEFKALPERSEIFENQRDIIGGIVKALHNLVGWDWGQYGEAIFFVQGAYRNEDNDLKTFNVSVTPNAAKIASFALTLPDYKDVLRAPFRQWAENVLPAQSSPSENNSQRNASIDSPTVELDNDISELDSPIQNPLSPVECGESCTASPMDKGTYSDVIDLQLPDSPPLLPVHATSVASPAIDSPPQPSPPLSESMVVAAIKNVAEAGYLQISEPTISPNQVQQQLKTRSQQSGKVKTSNSNSRKRRREEQPEGSPNEDKKVKKQVVHTREQSSRLKDANYRNKHVTVRPR